MVGVALFELRVRVEDKPSNLATDHVATLKLSPNAIYIGQVDFNTSKLANDLYVQIAVQAFNATGTKLKLRSISGAASYYDTPEMKHGTVLPQPQGANDGAEKTYDNLTPMLFVFDQRIPSDVASQMLGILKSGKRVAFDLSKLNITVESQSSEAIRLPLWSAVTLDQEGTTRTRMMNIIRANIVVGG